MITSLKRIVRHYGVNNTTYTAETKTSMESFMISLMFIVRYYPIYPPPPGSLAQLLHIQFFIQKILIKTLWMIFDSSEDFITIVFIEFRGLEAECI